DGGELFEQRGATVIVEEFWTRNQRFRLLCHGFSDHGMGVSEARHAHPGGTVDVLLALVIPQACPLATYDGDTAFCVHPPGVAFLELLEGCHGHSFSELPSPALAAPVEWDVRCAHHPKSQSLPLAPGPRQRPSPFASSAPAPGPCRMRNVPCQC